VLVRSKKSLSLDILIPKGIANGSARSASRHSATVIGDVISASIGIEIPELIDLVFEISEESDVEVCEC
jgi:hypothetical protein